MEFLPPRCPYRCCTAHLSPSPRFYRRHGFYQPGCRRRPVPRFRCLSCRRTFSRQTFRHDYRDRRPHTNVPLLHLLTSGVGLRQAGRVLGLDPHSVQRKLRKQSRTCQLLHRNLSGRLPAGRYLLDEEETYEQASIHTVTMPVLIEKESWFVVAASAGPIRRLAAVGSARRVRQALAEAHAPRRDRSRICVRAVLRTLRQRLGGVGVQLWTDEKASYRALAHEVFGRDVEHVTTSGELERGTWNPLFPINTTLAMTRDNCGRLRRRSWLVTKKRRCLTQQMHLFACYRNYVRRRFNRDAEHETPAQLLGLLPRQLRLREVLAWRQDWGSLSVHPTSAGAARTVAAAA